MANQYYHGLVDMGSNGIRFSISDLSPKTARIIPTVYQDRCGVSLYDAQYKTGSKAPIPPDVIQDVLAALHRFKRTCTDFEVPPNNVRIIATEATREAVNSVEYRNAIEEATGWKVEMLAKEDEGRIGAMGVASSFSSVRGLVMDLGGGSTQLTWLSLQDGKIDMSPRGSVSLPYGAAALMIRLDKAEKQGGSAKEALHNEMVERFKQAVRDIEIPGRLAAEATARGGLKLYLSGGGFRGWGYILMASHPVQPYPIPVINGFSIPVSSFKPQVALQAFHGDSDTKIFRVSNRRASQVPAVSFLIDALLEALPTISTIYFAQGGVREGAHFSTFSDEVHALHPLNAATSVHAPPSTSALLAMLEAGLPDTVSHSAGMRPPDFLCDSVFLTSLVHLLSVHAPLPKDTRSAAGLLAPTVGILAGIHGLAHEDRALMAIALCWRWGGEVAPVHRSFYDGLAKLVGGWRAWWAQYVGILAGAVGDFYPAGVVGQGENRFELTGSWEDKGPSGQAERGVGLAVYVEEGGDAGWTKDLEKLGKKKRWIDGEGLKVWVHLKGATRVKGAL